MMTRVRIRLATWLLWLVQRIAPPAEAPKPNPLADRVRELVAEAASLDAGGEYKKWQYVASKLQKQFPSEKHRDLNLLIELEIQRRHAAR